MSRAVVHYQFELPDNKRRDAANLVHACKAAIDGIVDSGLIPDDCWQVLTIGSVSCGVVKPGRVVLTFVEIRGDEDTDGETSGTSPDNAVRRARRRKKHVGKSGT
jgi:hypothetical protein